MRAACMVMGSIVVRDPARHGVSVCCTLTGWPPDSPPSSLATAQTSSSRELCSRRNGPPVISVSGPSKDVLHDLYF